MIEKAVPMVFGVERFVQKWTRREHSKMERGMERLKSGSNMKQQQVWLLQ